MSKVANLIVKIDGEMTTLQLTMTMLERMVTTLILTMTELFDDYSGGVSARIKAIPTRRRINGDGYTPIVKNLKKPISRRMRWRLGFGLLI